MARAFPQGVAQRKGWCRTVRLSFLPPMRTLRGSIRRHPRTSALRDFANEGMFPMRSMSPPTLATSRFSLAYTFSEPNSNLVIGVRMESIAWSRSRSISGFRAWACKAAQRASWGTKKTFSALYSSASSGSAYGVSWSFSKSSSKASEMYLRKPIRGRRACTPRHQCSCGACPPPSTIASRWVLGWFVWPLVAQSAKVQSWVRVWAFNGTSVELIAELVVVLEQFINDVI